VVQFTLEFQKKSYGHLSISLIFWIAVATLIQERFSKLSLTSNWLSCGLGAALLMGLVAVTVQTQHGRLLGFYPFLSAIGLGLMASGWQRLGQYRQELTGLFLLGVPKLISQETFNIAPITAIFSAAVLWLTGFRAELQGIHIALPPNGGVNVVASCSGLNLMLYMFAIAIIFLILFPTTRSKQILLPILAMGLGFMCNGARVAMLVVLTLGDNRSRFDYWHSEEGALIFVLISVALFGLLCWVLLGPMAAKSAES
jgi:cyanoexosortase A